MEGDWSGRFGQKRPRAITRPGSTCPLPAGPAHLDPAGPRGHLVHPPLGLNVNPCLRGAPHVGASGSHVSAPPAQVPGSAQPLAGTQTGRGRYAAREGGAAPAPSPDARSGKELGKGGAGGSWGYRGGIRGSWDEWRNALASIALLSQAPRLAGNGRVRLTPRPPCGLGGGPEEGASRLWQPDTGYGGVRGKKSQNAGPAPDRGSGPQCRRP